MILGATAQSYYSASRGQAFAESPESTPRTTTHVSESSTLPLSSVPRIEYDMTEDNVKAAIQEFIKLLGVDGVELKHGERKSRSSTEWSAAPSPDDVPSVIVFPKSTQDVSEIAKVCHRRRIPMIGFSGGTSLEGTLAAQNKEVCVDFRNMNQILEFRKDDMDVTVQPSVGYIELNQFLGKHGAFFPPDPGPGAQVGGMIAQGCSGPNAYRYGTMKDWVLGLEVVLADGTIIKTRGRPRKSSSGYDMTRLFVGSEGTLGFVTQAHLKLTRSAQNVKVGIAQFETIEDAIRMAVNVVQSGHQLECMEFLDGFTMKAVNQAGYCEREYPEKPSIFFKVAGPDPSHAYDTAKVAEKLAKEAGAFSFELAKDDEEAEGIWQARKTALWSLLACKNNPDDKFLSADACVPISALGRIIPAVQAKIDEGKLLGSFLGHVGDGKSAPVCEIGSCPANMRLGNFHTTVLYSADQKDKARQIVHETQRMAVDMGGTVSGEHGIGLEYRDQVVYELGEESVDAMRRVKFALDPLCLLNPGKMIRVKPE